MNLALQNIHRASSNNHHDSLLASGWYYGRQFLRAAVSHELSRINTKEFFNENHQGLMAPFENSAWCCGQRPVSWWAAY